MQLDLIDVTNINQRNDGIKFLLTIICSFTKKAWIFPITNKKSDVVLRAFKSFINNIDKIPRSILMDAGTEFVLVRKLCAENNIKTYLPIHLFMVPLLKGLINQLKIVSIDGWIQIKLKIT